MNESEERPDVPYDIRIESGKRGERADRGESVSHIYSLMIQDQAF